jgi:hypothetical protein
MKSILKKNNKEKTEFLGKQPGNSVFMAWQKSLK